MTTVYKGRGALQVTGRGRQTGKSSLMGSIAAVLGNTEETYKLIIEQNEGRVYGARYHTVHPVITPVWNTEPKIWNEMMDWMIDTFGPAPKDGVFTPGARWYANNAKFWFRDEKDMLVFLLRWQ